MFILVCAHPTEPYPSDADMCSRQKLQIWSKSAPRTSTRRACMLLRTISIRSTPIRYGFSHVCLKVEQS